MKTYKTIEEIDARFAEIKALLKTKVSDSRYRDLTSEAIYLKEIKTKLEKSQQK
jgi:hypothetical protein